MAFKLVDRVRETTISPGTGTATLAGAALGYQSFSAGVGANNTTYYVIADQSGANWEVGYGTVGAGGTTLARTTVLSSSNAGSLVNFSSGTQDVWVDYPATKAVWLDTNGDISQAIRNISGITGAITTPESITFDTAPAIIPTATGSMYWDAGNKTPSLVLDADVSLQVGQENVALVYNGTGATITNGSVVAVNGAQGQRPSVALADADSEALSAPTLGIATEDIANGAEGFITTFGFVRGLNTSAFTAGAPIYLSQTAGQFTATRPAAPAHTVALGWVIKVNASSGEVFVNINNGWEIGELHDVLISSPTGGQLLAYDQTNSYWKNISLGAGTGFAATAGTGGTLSIGASVAAIGTWMGTPSSANLLAAMTDETGTGSLVFATSPTLVTPLLGTPTSGTLTNCTGLPVATGISGLGTGVATFLATPSSANLRTAVTDETGTGSLVFATSPTLVTPALGTPSSGVLTNCTALPPAQVSGAANTATSYFGLPGGTTAQRPGSPANGNIRYNSDLLYSEVYQNGNWWQMGGLYTIDYVVVGGGGGGGLPYGGGGGAGGYRTGSATVVSGDSNSVVVGAGGSTNPSGSDGYGGQGGSSSFAAITSLGGGGGGFYNVYPGVAGASGGGGGGRDSGTSAGGSGTSGQGNAGGTGTGSAPQYGGAGGGGGSSAVGQNGTSGTSGHGGDGGAGTTWLNGVAYAGGGGGGNGANAPYSTTGGTGAAGGGNGANYTTPATASAANRGSGGGGAGGFGSGGNVGTGVGSAGGSGVVIVRYPGAQRGSGGTVSSAGGYTYHTFTTSGTFIA